MRSPVRPLPETISRWTSRARYLRWLDAVAAWLVLWLALAVQIADVSATADALLALMLTGLGAAVPPLRVRWRPVSAMVGLKVSRDLRVGDRAWWVLPGRAHPVVVVARRWGRVVIAGPAARDDDGITVRRTRVLLVPADR